MNDELGEVGRPRRENDQSYRNLFNHPQMMEWLLRRYVAQSWVDSLDMSTWEPVKTSFVGPENQRRDSDLIWRAKLGDDGQWFYVYVLVEFQSKPERFMALRVLQYLCFLYEDLIRQKRLTPSGRLPPVLPIVLYNGSRPWQMPLDLKELIEPVGGGLETYLPSFCYLVLDEGHLPKEELEPLDNPVTAVFQLEQVSSFEELQDVVRALKDVLDGPDLEGPRRDMLTWLRRVILPAVCPGEEFPELRNLKETDEMLAERVKKWPEQWKAEGFEKGRQSVLSEALQGFRNAVGLQLQLRFGELGEQHQALLNEATEPDLMRWAERLLTASGVDEVFE